MDKRIVASIVGGESTKSIAEKYKISIRTVYRYKNLIITSHPLHGNKSGRPRKISSSEENDLLSYFRLNPAMTLKEYEKAMFENYGIALSYRTIQRILKRNGLK